MNCLIGVYRIIIKIIHDFSLFLPINPPIIRLPIGITSKMRCSPKVNEPISQQNLPVNKEAIFPEGEQAHTQAGLFYGVLQLQTVGSAPALSERTPEGRSELSTAAHFHERERV
jgi:hypothetical protein